MNAEFIKFIQEEVKKLHKLTLLKEEKRTINKKLIQLNENYEPLDSYDNLFQRYTEPRDAIHSAIIGYNHAIKSNNTGMADKISGNLKSHLESMNYDWKKDPYALEVLGDFLNESKWMQKAFSKKGGSLHSALGVPKDEKISVSKMKQALANPKR